MDLAFTMREQGTLKNTSTAAFTVTHGWDESNIVYDKNGNIQSLDRYDSSPGAATSVHIDHLGYTYDANNDNQLVNVSDGTTAQYTGAGFRNLTGSTGSYSYDSNGSLIADPYKGITSISYNLINRTNRLTITASQYIDYTYSSSGELIRKQAYKSGTTTQVTDYIDGFVYVNSTLSYFPMPEGRVRNDAGTLKQEFVMADQQGNARVSFEDDGSGNPVVRQENSYYGFGLILPNSPVTTPTTAANKQLYNGGSEWQNDYTNLPDYYNTFYRNYDAAIGRFVGVDPDPESAESLSVYNYSGNNPIMYNDPLGNFPPGVSPDVVFGQSLRQAIPFWGGVTQSSMHDSYYNYDNDPGLMTDHQLAVAAKNGVPGAYDAYVNKFGKTYSLTGYNSSGKNYYFDSNGKLTDTFSGFGGATTYEVPHFDAGNNRWAGYDYLSPSEGVLLLALDGLDANQGGDQCPTCLIPSSVGHNIFENYAGGNNPMSYNGKENYSISPVNYTDLNTMHHDLNYDAHGGKGALSVFFSPSLMPDDYALIGSSFGVAFDTGRVTLKDKGESLAVGLFFSIFTAPKSVVYWMNTAAQNMPASEFPGL